MNNITYPVLSYIGPNPPGSSTMWINGTAQSLGSPNSNIPIGYQPQGQIIYPFSVLQSSPGLGSQINPNNLPPANLPLQNYLWNSSGVLVQTAPTPLILTSPLTVNPQFAQHIPREQLVTQTLGIGSPVVPTSYSGTKNQEPLSAAQVTSSYEQQQMLLQQQQEQLHQQQTASRTTNQSQLKSTENQNITELKTVQYIHSAGTGVPETQTDSSINSSSQENVNGPFYIASVQEAPPSTYLQVTNLPRQNILPGPLPTSLNPSLLINKDAKLLESASQQKLLRAPSFIKKDVIPQAPKVSKVETTQGRPVIASKFPQERSSMATSQSQQQGLQRSDSSVNNAIYAKPKNKDYCLRCGKKVYPMERTGPIKDVVYHKICFSCVTCGTLLTLKNFHHNPNDVDDLSVFCVSHKPKERTRSCDANAVHIKSALTAPKLDKVNDQIRADRYPSEVLTRSGNLQPIASALSPTRENLYYGMKVDEDTGTEHTRHSYYHQEQQLQKNEHYHHQQQERYTSVFFPDNQELPQKQLKQEQLIEGHEEQLIKNKKEQLTEDESMQLKEAHQEQIVMDNQEKLKQEQPSHHIQEPRPPSQQYDQQQYNQLIEQNFKLQQQILQNEEKIINDIANSVGSEDKGIPPEISNSLDASHLRNTQVNNNAQIVSVISNDEPDGKSPTSTLSSSSLSSSVIHQEISAEESLSHYIEAHFKLDNHEALRKQRQELYNTGGVQKFINRELSIQSSRSTSPMQIQVDSRSTEDNESRRSSVSSSLSSRESIDLGASATFISGRQQTPFNSGHQQTQVTYRHQQDLSNPEHLQITPSPGERADRPSSSTHTVIYNTPNERNLSARMIDRTKVNYNIEVPNPNRDMDRFLPKNERMRMDRPSQYS